MPNNLAEPNNSALPSEKVFNLPKYFESILSQSYLKGKFPLDNHGLIPCLPNLVKLDKGYGKFTKTKVGIPTWEFYSDMPTMHFLQNRGR